MWIFDRTRTEYGDSVDKFITAVKLKYAEDVFKEIAKQFNVSLEASKNSYATPIFHLGVGYKVAIQKYLLGKTEVKLNDIDADQYEFRLTEAAKLYASGKIDRETFMTINIIKFQVLNSTLELKKFNEKLGNKVLPLLLTLQVLKALELIDPANAYIDNSEMGWLYEKMDHNDINGFARTIIEHRMRKDTPPPNNGADAFFKLFQSTGLVVDRTRVPLGGVRRRVLALAARKSMVISNILENPPEYFDITWDDRWRWAHYYITLIENIDRFIAPKTPYVLRIVLPDDSTYDITIGKLIVNTPFALTLQTGDYVCFDNVPEHIKVNSIYQIVSSPEFLATEKALINIREVCTSLSEDVNIANKVLEVNGG